MSKSFRSLEKALGHRFGDDVHLRNALVHRSYTAENPAVAHNERLEFLGDAVLQLVVTDYLFEEFPDLPEGQMAKVRAAVVNRMELAGIARAMALGDHLRLGRGESTSGGNDKESILSDALEAVIAAVYLDAGLEAARTVVLGIWESVIRARATDPGRRDYKTRLQEVLAAQGLRPRYRTSEDGPDHAKEFTAILEVDGSVLGRGSGRSKKEAEQAAAAEALTALG